MNVARAFGGIIMNVNQQWYVPYRGDGSKPGVFFICFAVPMFDTDPHLSPPLLWSVCVRCDNDSDDDEV